MIRGRLSLVVISLLLFVLACDQDPDYVVNYPQIISSRISSNDTAGVDVAATLDDAGMSDLTDVGVVWGEKPDLDIAKNFVLHLGKPTSAMFVAEVRSQLLAKKDYYIRVFLVGGEKTVYGTALKFTSYGSKGPVIQSISPIIIAPGDLLTIKGRGFGSAAKNIKVAFRLNSFYDQEVSPKTISDTLIVVAVPGGFGLSTKIVITTPENLPVLSQDLPRRLPKLTGMNSISLCDSIQFVGEDLSILGNPGTLNVNGQNIPVPKFKATSFSIPRQYHAPTLKIRFDFNSIPDLYGYVVEKTFNESIALPIVTSPSPANVPESGTLLITGTGFPVCTGMTALTDPANMATLEIIDTTPTQVTVKVKSVTCDNFKLILNFGGYTLYTSDDIAPAPPFTITSISPDHGIVGDKITAIGTNMLGVAAEIGVDPTFFNFSFDLDQFVESTNTKTTITLQAPENLLSFYHSPDGKTTIMLEKCGIQYVYPFDYQLYTPTLTDCLPKVSDGLQPLVITGTHFTSDPNIRVTLEGSGGYGEVVELQINDISDTSITTLPPRYSGSATGDYSVVIYQWGVRYVLPDPITFNF